MDPAGAADALQRDWQLPYELLDLAPAEAAPRFAVVTAEGAVYESANTAGAAEREADAATDAHHRSGAAFAVAARLPNGAAAAAATTAAAEGAALDWLQSGAAPQNHAAAWLLQVENGAVEALRGPGAVRTRIVAPRPVALLVDLGMVLVDFEREAFARNFRLAFGRPAPQAGVARVEAMRPALEAGERLADDFLDDALEPLTLARTDREALARVWGSILTLQPQTVALLRRAAALPQVALAVVSNTDPIRLRWCREELGLGDLLEWTAASCQDGVLPKDRDASLWARGCELARAQLGAEPATVIGVDDVRGHLARACEAGVLTAPVHFRHLAGLRYALGAAGLYLPQVR